MISTRTRTRSVRLVHFADTARVPLRACAGAAGPAPLDAAWARAQVSQNG
jgi:hypothetical protein